MKLNEIYEVIKTRIDQLDFSLLWNDFKPLKFALYNDKECFFDGEYIVKTNQFLANTAIKYHDEYIAIWHVSNHEIDYDILAAKIVHEMFHAFQYMHNESRFPNELEALKKYQYHADYLTKKIEENKLINHLISHFDLDQFNHFLHLRKDRMVNHPFEFAYDSAIEQIEGSANYVELETLRQLSTDKFQKALDEKQKEIVNIHKQIPVRIVCYAIGALLLYVVKKHTDIDVDGFSNKTFASMMLENIEHSSVNIKQDEEVEKFINDYIDETKRIILKVVGQNNCVARGKFDIIGINIFNARYDNHHIISYHFVAYKDKEEEVILYGDFVIRIDDDWHIESIYKLTDQ